nr:hypothetical protein [Tanacetum cinerariifolium]
MSTRSTSSNLFYSLRDPESLIRRRNLGEPSSLFDFEEVMSIPHNNQVPPHAGPLPHQNNNVPPSVVRPNGPAPRSMEELCQPSIKGRQRPIAPIPVQATDFGLRHHMIQQQNGVSDDALRLSLFPYSLTRHATTWLAQHSHCLSRLLDQRCNLPDSGFTFLLAVATFFTGSGKFFYQ